MKLDAAVVYRGPSLLPGQQLAPIVAIVTGLTGRSHNPKTGPMAQLWILRSDQDPLTVISRGLDGAICGDCGLRGTAGLAGSRGCYVAVKNAPLAVYKRLKRRNYRRRTASQINAQLRASGIRLRLGAYGDPAALPATLLQELTAGIRHTGYTHAWASLPAKRARQLSGVLMASVDSPQERARAVIHGWRTFRTRSNDQEIGDGEISCPASDEAGHRTTCERCCLCDGRQGGPGSVDARKSIVILAHGASSAAAVRFIRSRSEVLSC